MVIRFLNPLLIRWGGYSTNLNWHPQLDFPPVS